MRYLSSFILVAFTCFAYPHVHYANAANGDIHYEQCSKPIHEVYDLKGGNDELIERRAHETPATLCASLDGVTFEIDSTEWEDQFIYLSLVLVEDFDGDGWEEAIIKLSTGGNGCCWEHYLVSYAGEGYFKITTDDFFIHADHFSTRNYKNQTVLKALTRSQTRDFYLYEDLQEYSVHLGELKLSSSSRNKSLILTDFKIDQRMVSKNPNRNYATLIDQDEKEDQIRCSTWGRSYLLSCDLSLTTGLRVTIPTFCRTIGFVSRKTNGIRDLVCNLNQLFKLDSNGIYRKYDFSS